MSFNGQISGSLAPQGAMTGSVSGNIGAVTPAIRDGAVTTAKLADEAVTTAKLADAAVTIAKLAADVTALINSKGSASDVATLQSDVEALQTITAGLGTASTYGVANSLTQAAAGSAVLDAYQGKLLGDRMTTAEGEIDTLNDGYTNITRRTDGTITLPSGYSYSGDHSSILSKINGIVMASVSVQPPSSALSSGWTTIMTLPSGYRPIVNISMPVAYYAGANVYTSSLRATVNTDGKVNVFTNGALSNVIRMQLNATFPAA